ncbi:MAG: HAD family phosphatase [Anaerolinea sp.]|nr:HAD family phosphatase [Anaerolinea sp.]
MSPIPSPFAILWDLDGTLVDTKDFHHQSWALTAPEFNFDFSTERFERSFGMNNNGMLEVFLGRPVEPELVQAIGERKETLFRELLHGNVQALPGAISWLERLRGWGARQAVASSAPPANIDVMLGELGIAGTFDAIVSGHALPSKPDPAVFWQAAQHLDLSPDACIVMEDAVVGVQAARRAGMRCIAVASTHPPAALHEADLVVAGWDRLDEESFVRLAWDVKRET